MYKRARELLPEDRVVHIDSNRSLEDVGAEIFEVVTAALGTSPPNAAP